MRRLETEQVILPTPPRAIVVFALGVTRDKIGERMESGTILLEVLDRWDGPLGAVPAMLVEAAADPMCRTFGGVMAALCAEAKRPVASGDNITALVLRWVGTDIQRATSIPRNI